MLDKNNKILIAFLGLFGILVISLFSRGIAFYCAALTFGLLLFLFVRNVQIPENMRILNKVANFKPIAFKHEKLVYSALIVLVVLLFSSIYFFNSMPITLGWNIYNVELIKHGMLPYKDFYYHMPPFTLLVDYVFWSCSFDIYLLYRFYYLLERIVMLLLIFNLCSKFFNNFDSALGTIFCSIITFSDVYDDFGDYNQTAILLSVVFIYIAVNFARSENFRQKMHTLFFAGIVLGLMFLCKQTVFAATFLVFFIGLTAICVSSKDKKYPLYVLSCAVGTIIPILVLLGWLLYNNILPQFIDQVFLETSGKGSIFEVFVRRVFYIIADIRVIFTTILLLLLFYFYKNKEKKYFNVGLLLSLYCFVILFCDSVNVISFFDITAKFRGVLSLVIVFIVLFVLTQLFSQRNNVKDYGILELFVLVGVGTIVAMFVVRQDSITSALYSFNLEQALYYFSRFVFLLLILFAVQEFKKDGAIFLLVCWALAVYYSLIMTCNIGNLVRLVFFASPIFVCLVLRNSKFVSNNLYLFLKTGGCVFGVVLSLVCVSYKAHLAYTWWGAIEDKIYNKKYSLDAPVLKGIKQSERQKEIFDGITKLVLENSDEDDYIWSYPHIKIFNIMANRYNQKTFMPVLFYDVCADKYVKQELELLKENNPEIIIWEDIPYCVETHERVYRKGKPLEQRKIIEWFEKQKNTNYKELGQYGPVSVWKKISDEEKAVKLALEKESLEWNDGEGTLENPCKISSKEDLKKLSLLVNEGFSFSGKHFLQTMDIDLENEEFTPIGIFDSGKYFEGTYDGGGHCIKNLLIVRNDNTGMFGTLAGVVKNLGIESGYISGVCVGAIASHGVNNRSIILNCYNKAGLHGFEGRVGGICDNFIGGSVINCQNYGKIDGKEIAPVVSYNANFVENISPDMVPESFTGIYIPAKGSE